MASPAAPSTDSAPSGGGDYLDALRSEAISTYHAHAAGDSGESGSTSEPDPAVTSESTSDAPAELSPEGSTPASETAPAPTSAPLESLLKRYGDPQRIEAEFFALEKRAAEMAKALKSQTPEHPASPETVAAQPTAQPAPAEPPVTQPAHPAQVTEDIHAQAIKAAESDRVCRELDARFTTNDARLKELSQEIPKLNSDIAYLERKAAELQQTEAALRATDPLRADDYAEEARKTVASLDRIKLTHERSATEATRLQLQQDHLLGQYNGRVEAYKGQFAQEAQSRTREAQLTADIDKDAKTFAQTFAQSFEAEFSGLKDVPVELKADIWQAVKGQAALAQLGGMDNPTEFVRTAIKAEATRLEKFERLKFRDYALRKQADTSPTGAGPAATSNAPSVPPTGQDSVDSLRMLTRQAMASRTR